MYLAPVIRASMSSVGRVSNVRSSSCSFVVCLLTCVEVKETMEILHSRLETRIQIFALDVLDRAIEFAWTHD